MEDFETILKKNMSYIYTVAFSMGINSTDNDYNDLIQVGRISLYDSYVKYDELLGVPFMKYAGLNVKYAMIAFLDNNSKTIRVPVSQIYSDNGGVKSIPTVSTEKLLLPTSDSSTTIGELIADEDTSEDEEYALEMKTKLITAIGQLKEDHQRIIKLYYGIDTPNEKKYNCIEIAKMTGCTKQNINAKKNVAIKKLQELMS